MGLLSRFRSDERGTVAIIFGFAVIILALFSGVAVDVNRAYGVSSAVSSALDSTALAVARELQKRDMSDTEVQQFAQLRYNALLAKRANSGVTFKPLAININRSDETVQVTATSVVPMFFAGVAGTETMTVNETSTVSYNVRVVELAMMLDVTGSMSGSRIESLRLAATDLITELVPESPRSKSNRIALAPYAAAVRVGLLSTDVTAPGNDSADGCVIGRDGFEATTDAPPGNGAWFEVVPAATIPVDLDPIDGSSSYVCPPAEILPLSNNRQRLIQEIDSFAPDGFTAGHLGAAWAWYLISPKWAYLFDSASRPQPYSDADTIKAVLLMTDGTFNTRFIGSAGDTSDAQAREICTNMKARNVTVYAVAFMASTAAEDTLRNCATSSTHYFTADNQAELRDSFRQVARTLTSLRLTD